MLRQAADLVRVEFSPTVIANAHQLIAPLVAAAGIGLLAVVVVAAARHRTARFATDRVILVALALVGLGIASGLLVLLAGSRPADPLHFLYAGVALAVLPVARFWGRLERYRAPALGIAGIVLAALVLRLFQTG
jgi:hypothetical protein